MLNTFNAIVPERKIYQVLYGNKNQDTLIGLHNLEKLQDLANYDIGGDFVCIGATESGLDLYYDAEKFSFYYYNSHAFKELEQEISNPDYILALKNAYACGLLSRKFYEQFGRNVIRCLS